MNCPKCKSDSIQTNQWIDEHEGEIIKEFQCQNKNCNHIFEGVQRIE